MLDDLVRAARTRDRAAFDARTGAADLDPWFESIGALPWQQLSFSADGPTAELAAARRQELGPDTALHQVTLRWQLTGQPPPAAEHRLWLTTAPTDGTLHLLSATDLPAGATHDTSPMWLWEAARYHQGPGQVGVLTAASASPVADWFGWVAGAVAAVQRFVPSLLRPRWPGGLLLQVPSTRAIAERVLGVTPGAVSSLAAAAWPMGPDAEAAAVQIVVNPEAVAAGRLLDRSLDPMLTALQVLLTHEAVHVAVHSPGSPAPLWLVEGYADHVAYRAHPLARAAAARDLLTQVRRGRIPAALPSDRALTVGDDLDLAYAQAWTGCWYVAKAYGETRLARLYRAADQGMDLDGALRSTLGADLDGLTRGWQAELRRLAADPPW